MKTGRTQGRPGGIFASYTGVSENGQPHLREPTPLCPTLEYQRTVGHTCVNRTTRQVRVDLWQAQGRPGSAFTSVDFLRNPYSSQKPVRRHASTPQSDPVDTYFGHNLGQTEATSGSVSWVPQWLGSIEGVPNTRKNTRDNAELNAS